MTTPLLDPAIFFDENGRLIHPITRDPLFTPEQVKRIAQGVDAMIQSAREAALMVTMASKDLGRPSTESHLSTCET
jgi:hypothetical protein